MSNPYEELLSLLDISSNSSSFEISKQLKKKREEYKNCLSSKNTIQQNSDIEEKIHEIYKAEQYFEQLVKKEKKDDKLDGFDYSSLKNKRKKESKQRIYISNLSFEERYEKIIAYMKTPDGFENGLEQLKQLGEEGFVVAQNRLGGIYFFGEENITIDYEQARYWYEKAANQHDEIAENHMGVIYLDGLGVNSDQKQAIYWLKKAVEDGNKVAPWNLGLAYEVRFEEKDYEKAIYWYKKAAECEDIKAYHKIGYMYMSNEGLLPNREEAIYWLKKAVEAGDEMALLNLGRVYGKCFEEKDYAKAVYYYEKAVECGETNLYNELGFLYENCLEIRNYEKAVYYYEKAAECGEIDLYNKLGFLYENCLEEKNYEKMIYWYTKDAEEFENAEVMCKLGKIYETINKDDVKAAEWYLKAIQYGNCEAQERFDILSQKAKETVRKNKGWNFFKRWKI